MCRLEGQSYHRRCKGFLPFTPNGEITAMAVSWRLRLAVLAALRLTARAATSPALRATARQATADGSSQADFLKILRRKTATQQQATAAVEGLRAGGYLGGVRGYSSAIVASRRGRKWELAIHLFDEMLEQGLRPSASAFTAAAEACQEGDQPELAARVREAGAVPVAKKTKKASGKVVVPSTASSGTVLYSKGALCTRFRQKDASAERLAEAAELLRSGGHFEETLSYTTALRNCHGLRPVRVPVTGVGPRISQANTAITGNGLLDAVKPNWFWPALLGACLGWRAYRGALGRAPVPDETRPLQVEEASPSGSCECPLHIFDMISLEPASACLLSSLDFLEAWMLRAVCRQMQDSLSEKAMLTRAPEMRVKISEDSRNLATTAEIFLSVLAFPQLLEQADCAGQTLLMRAAHLGIPRLCRALLAAKAAVDARGGNGWTALHYAATGKSSETCQLLLDHGADVEARSRDGHTPFYYAYRAGDEKSIMEVLHARGARPDLRSQNACGTADCGYLRYSTKRDPVEQDVVTFNVAIAALGRGQQWERSLCLLDGMPAANIEPDFETYQALSLACSRNGEWEKALTFLATAQELGVANSESWHIGMMACAGAGAWEATLEMLECAGTPQSPKDVSRDLMCYGVALYACMEAGRWPQCLSLLEQMRLDEVEPDSIALACAAQACRDGRNKRAADEIQDEMRQRKLDYNVAEVLNEATLAVDFPEVRSPVPLGALRPMAQKEVQLFKWIRQRATPGDVQSVIKVIEEFAEERSWLKIQGEQKKELLEATLRPEDRIVEFGCYVGYSSMVMAQRLRELGGRGSVTTCEVDAANAYIARGVLQFAGVEGEVQVRVGCACDWVATGQLGTIDFLLLDHRGTIYHEDLHAAEPSLSETAIVFADNVLYPGAPLFLNYIDVQGYAIEIHELKEFKRPDLDDWVVICKPPPPEKRKEMPTSQAWAVL
ncbi:comtb [Symbiodinium sp. CCMP2592]|nr:comtb [Symbiodinium sp. CCMP2592]